MVDPSRIAASVPDAEVELLGPPVNRVLGFLRIEAAGLPILTSAEIASNHPDIRVTTMADLRRTGRVPDLVRCYKDVFGADERTPDGELVWGEGARCGDCRVNIPLPKFRELAVEPDPACPNCGEGLLIEIFEDARLRSELEHKLSPRPGWDPVVTLVEGPDGRIEGFLYGGVTTRREAVRAIVEAQSVYEGAPDAAVLGRFFGAGEGDSLVFYVDAMAIDPTRRADGIRLTQGLAALSYTAAWEAGAASVMAWTNPRSPALGLMLSNGYDIVGSHDDYVYLLLRDIVPIMTIVQHATAEELTVTVGRAFEIVTSQVTERA